MARLSPLLILPPLLFAGLAVLFLWGMQRPDPTALPSARVGGPAPALTLAPLGGLTPVDPALLAAPGVKLVNFWASWCAPCRAEHPNLSALAAEGVTILGVNYKDNPADAMAFLSGLGNPFAAVSADPTGRTGLDWGIYGVPETFVVDGGGKVVLRIPGPLTQRVIDGTLRPALAAAKR